MDISIATINAVSFYLFAGLAVVSAVSVIMQANPVNSAMSLVGTFFSLAAVYVLLNSHFIAVMQILVYAGAIMVLVIFVIMLLNLRPSQVSKYGKRAKRSFIILFFVALMIISMISILSMVKVTGKSGMITAKALADQGTIQIVSRSLFSEFLLPFELTSLLLTVAIIGVVILAKGMGIKKKEPSA